MIITKKMIFIYKNYYLKLYIMERIKYLILEQIISEGRVEEMIEKYNDDLSERAVRELSAKDPSGNNKYLDWMCKQRAEGYSLEYIADKLRCFHENVNRLSDKNIESIFGELFSTLPKVKSAPKDINSYPSVENLEPICTFFEEKKPKNASRIKIYEDDRWLIVSPLTHQASCQYGSHSNWCVSTSNKDYYDRYTKEGLLVFFLDKKGFNPTKPEANIYKFAVHIEFKNIEPTQWDWYSMEDKNIDAILMLNLLPRNLIDVTSKFVKEYVDELFKASVITIEDLNQNTLIWHELNDNTISMVFDFKNKSVREALSFFQKNFLPEEFERFVKSTERELETKGFPIITLETKLSGIHDFERIYLRWPTIRHLGDYEENLIIKLSDLKNYLFEDYTSGVLGDTFSKFNESQQMTFLYLIKDIFNKNRLSIDRADTYSLQVGDRVSMDGEIVTVKRVAEKTLLLSNGKRKLRSRSTYVTKYSISNDEIIDDLT